MRVGASGTHLRRHPDRLHHLFGARALTLGLLRVAFDAVRALRDMRNRDSDQLLRLLIDGALSEDLSTELLERGTGLRHQLPALPQQLGRPLGVGGFRHDVPFSLVPFDKLRERVGSEAGGQGAAADTLKIPDAPRSASAMACVTKG